MSKDIKTGRKQKHFMKAAGTAGASSNELTAVAAPKLGQKLMDFIQQYGKVQVAKIGDRGASVRYKLA